MDKMLNMSPEEMQKEIERLQKEIEANLSQMTPEERAKAEAAAQKMIEDDEAERQAMLEKAKNILSDEGTAKSESKKFCPSCGAPAGNGSICEYCRNPL